MATPGWPIRVLRVVVATSCVAVAGWYGPLLTAAGWHLFHPGGWIRYRGLNVQVPWPWTSDVEAVKAEPTVNPEGISLKRMPYTMDRRLSNQSVFVTVISPDAGKSAQQQTDGWMEIFRVSHPGATFDDRTPQALPANTSCLSAQNHWSQHGVVWTCISVEGGWVADFEGQVTDVPAFFRIVSNLKR